VYFHTRWLSDLAPNTISADASGNTNSSAQFGMDGGMIQDEDIQFTISAVGATVGLPIFYNSGSTPVLRRVTQSGYSVYNGGSGQPYWNNPNAGGAGVWGLTRMSGTNYFLMHIFATNDTIVGTSIIAVMGQALYSTIGNAQTGATTELNSILTAFPASEFKPLATFIFQSDSSYTNAVKARVRSVSTGVNFVDWRNTQTAGSVNSIALPIASATTLGGVIVSSGLAVDSSGNISVSSVTSVQVIAGLGFTPLNSAATTLPASFTSSSLTSLGTLTSLLATQSANNPANATYLSEVIGNPTYTASANLTYASFGSVVNPIVNSTFSVTNAMYAVRAIALRNNIGASTDDSGTLTAINGVAIRYGHAVVNASATPQTTAAYGLALQPYAQSGTIGTMYDLYIYATAGAGTVTNHWGLYQVGANDNYLTGNLGIGLNDPQLPLEILTAGRISRNAGGAALFLYRFDGTRVSPTPIQSGEILGEIRFGGSYDTTQYHDAYGAIIQGTAEGTYSSTSALATGVSVWTNNGAGIALAATFAHSRGLTVVGAFGCNGKAAQTAYSVGSAAPAGGTGTAAGGWDTAAHRDSAITLLNNLRIMAINLGFAV
jgi:hypothetical protein